MMPRVDLDSTPKEQLIAMLGNLPDDLTFEDIQYHLYVLEKFNKVWRARGKVKVYTQEEVEEWMEKRFATLEQEASERENR